jgi:hypothetical protein
LGLGRVSAPTAGWCFERTAGANDCGTRLGFWNLYELGLLDRSETGFKMTYVVGYLQSSVFSEIR